MDELIEELKEIQVDILNLKCNPVNPTETRIADILEDLADSVLSIAQVLHNYENNIE